MWPALGEDCGPCKIGDAVCALLGGGGYAEYALAQSGLRAAAARRRGSDRGRRPARSALHRLDQSDGHGPAASRAKALLIHGGSSGIGVIAIQIFAARGHTVFATAGSDEKCRLCEQLGARRAINYRTEDFVAVMKDETGGKGVDVILDMVGGDYIQRNMTAAAIWGRIVNIAYQNGRAGDAEFRAPC